MKQAQITNGDNGHEANGERGPVLRNAWLWQTQRYLFFLGRHWWILALTIALFASLGYAYNRWMPQSYASTARLWMPGEIKVADAAVYEDRGQSQDIGSTQAELLKSDLLQSRAMAELSGSGIAPLPPNSVKLKVTQVARTSLLEVTARSVSSNYVRAYLNAIMDQILAYESEIHNQQSEVTYSSLSEQIGLKETELKAQQEKLTSYMRSNNVPILEETAKAASTYLTELLADYSRLALEYKLLKAASSDETLALNQEMLPQTKAAATAQPEDQAQSDLEKLKLLRASFARVYRPQHPKMVRLEEQIQQAQMVCDTLHRKNRDQLTGTMNMVKLKMDSTQEAITNWESKVNDASERIADYERVKLDEERMRGLCDHLRALLQNVDVSRNLPRYSLSVLDRASLARPVKLDPRLVVAMTVLFGLAAGLVLVRLVEMTSDKVTSLEYLNHHFIERIVGQIPEVPKVDLKGALSPPALESARHLYAESFRSVRSNLFFGAGLPEPPRLILVTSAVPREGKSTVAANLATTIAFGGSRVLLIDGDMRCGKLHEIYGLPQEPGLAELLSEEGDLASYVRATATKNLSLLSCGSPDGRAGELLLSRAFDRMLKSARSSFDFVIIDSVPILATDDTANAAPKTDGILFVMRDSYTSCGAAERALRSLYERRVRVLGIIYNQMRSPTGNYYYPEYYQRGPARLKSGAMTTFEGQAQ
jgi:capsular exopolysaccharide synthesis family protein